MTVNFTEYLGEMMDLCFSRRAEDVDHRYLDSGDTSSSRAILTCTIPLSEIVTDFFDQLKSRSSGFASFEYVFFSPLFHLWLTSLCSYEDSGYKKSNLAKVRAVLLPS
jgi:translation elongation factor EF-4